MTTNEYEWYDTTRRYTLELTHTRSVNPGVGESRAAEDALRLLHEDGLAGAYTLSGLDPIADDPYGRHNAYAFVQGQSRRTVVLFGHVDTVGTSDYGPLEPWALDPAALAARLDALGRLVPELASDLAAHPGDWMFGRGVADMKSGVAATIAVTRRLALQAREGDLPLSVVLLAVVDEENESAGALQGVRLLHALRERYGLEYVGAIDTDYTAARYPGDPHRYIYTGTVGKLLPSLFVVGQTAHAGDPFAGVDVNLLVAELVRAFSMNVDLCDAVDGFIAPPPVTLHATDLKTGYDTQLPYEAYLYLNIVTLTTTPAQLLETLRTRAASVLSDLLTRMDTAGQRWLRDRRVPSPEEPAVGVSPVPALSRWTTGMGEQRSERPALPDNPRGGTVLTYAALHTEVVRQLGAERVGAALDEEWRSCAPDLDSRERCLRLVRRLWTLSGRQGPAVVLYYAPPYYPHVASRQGPLRKAVEAVAAGRPELNLLVEDYFPLLSDMSYFGLDPSVDLAALRDNMPVWQEQGEQGAPTHAGAYSLPLDAMRSLDIPVANIGPYGRDVHQPGERVLMSYSFGVVPQLLYETIERLAHVTEERQ